MAGRTKKKKREEKKKRLRFTGGEAKTLGSVGGKATNGNQKALITLQTTDIGGKKKEKEGGGQN